ncbi:hypothetical protein [Alienimonas californiensis]|uniref:Uncharacterized protein n=1 Tax=Alienimonas californiensis TaxID=2527989 RepID=A0A517PB29_9PLAN|nr:hypothetical protein [Alienimonas californiensis]QDT16585.1 hypothetical protein CA12_26910 [Alienimonas californiensis]
MSGPTPSSAAKPILWYFGSSFVLHLLWENAQMPLFETPDGLSWATFKMCLFATATGDMFATLSFYLIVAVIHRDLRWAAERSAYSHPATWVVPLITGVLMAIGFELWAVYVAERWTYGSMPLAPVLRVGVTPVLQMIVIPLAATACAWWSLSKRRSARGDVATKRAVAGRE